MKNLITTTLLSILAIFSSFDSPAQDIITVKTDIYTIEYNQAYQQPVYIKYSIICKPDAKSYPRNRYNFTRVSGIETSTGGDYENNIWDKGHMAPASTFSCREDWLKETFSYINCALQHENLNRGAWAALEAFERDLAGIYDDIEVEIWVHFSDSYTEDSTPARIPASFIKTICWKEADGNKKEISFEFPNEDTKGASFWSFRL